MYHVTGKGVAGLSLFKDDEDRRLFLWLLRSAMTRYGLGSLAHCLMGTHYHLVAQGRREDLSEAMRYLNGSYARCFNERHSRRGHVFADRFAAYVIRDERHLEEAVRYIAANPVIAGLCQSSEDWPWTWIAGADSETPPLRWLQGQS